MINVIKLGRNFETLTCFENPSTLLVILSMILKPQYLYVIRHHKLSISPGVHVYNANHVTLRKAWIVNIVDLYVNIKSRVDS
jgi:hypothetical protein